MFFCLKNVLPLYLAESLNYLIVSTDQTFQGRPWGFLKEVVDTFAFLQARFSFEYLFSASRKVLSVSVTESLFSIPIYLPLLVLDPISDVLKRVKRMGVTPSANTFFFTLHTFRLPVKTHLHEK